VDCVCGIGAFEPVAGKPKVHQESFCFSEGCSHFFEGVDDLRDLSGSERYQEGSQFRRVDGIPGTQSVLRRLFFLGNGSGADI
jgi:hypothetical protein